jgi:Mg2+ and Co2+ transporter CorA
MSKRYTFTRPYDDAYEIVDRGIDKAMKPEDVADLLNQQTQRIAELEEQLINSLENNNDLLRQIMELQSQLIKERLKG